MRRQIHLALALLATAGFALPAAAADAFPVGSVAFFDATACPTDWKPLKEADGRLVASLMAGGENGALVGIPLGNLEDRKHQHSFQAKIETKDVDYALLPGCCNDDLTESKTYTFGESTDPASTGLPYVQLLLCQKTTAPGGSDLEIPSSLVTYSTDASCPSGFSRLPALEGRFFVGLPQAGSPGLSFGGPTLKAQQAPVHDHHFSGSAYLKPQGIAGLSGGAADGYAAQGTYPYSGVTGASATDLPYIQLLTCVKD